MRRREIGELSLGSFCMALDIDAAIFKLPPQISFRIVHAR
jgi:hypothetical protein